MLHAIRKAVSGAKRNKLLKQLSLLSAALLFNTTSWANHSLLTAFYYPGDRKLTSDDLTANSQALKHLDIVIYSASVESLRPDGQGYYLPDVTRDNLKTLSQWLRKNHPHTKLMLSLGYWGPFHMRYAIIQPELRKAFINSIIHTLQDRSLGLAGIDIDWENVYSPIRHEIARFPYFIRDLELAIQHAKLGNDLLTVDIPANFIDKFPAPKKWIHYVNWANLMGYEYYGDVLDYAQLDGAFGKVTTAYQGKPPKYPTISLVSSLMQYHKLGIMNSKMVVVLPAYAIANQVDSTTKANNFGLRQRVIRRHEVTVYPYWQLLDMAGIYKNTKHGYQAHQYTFHAPARAKGFNAYWMNKGHEFISYPDPIAIKQIGDYVKHHKYRGLSIWELSDTIKFSNPNSLLRKLYY